MKCWDCRNDAQVMAMGYIPEEYEESKFFGLTRDRYALCKECYKKRVETWDWTFVPLPELVKTVKDTKPSWWPF